MSQRSSQPDGGGGGGQIFQLPGRTFSLRVPTRNSSYRRKGAAPTANRDITIQTNYSLPGPFRRRRRPFSSRGHHHIGWEGGPNVRSDPSGAICLVVLVEVLDLVHCESEPLFSGLRGNLVGMSL